MDRFEQMRVFAAVVIDAGSFVGASVALTLSKAALSRHVAELESRLGVRLGVRRRQRTTRKLSLSVGRSSGVRQACLRPCSAGASRMLKVVAGVGKMKMDEVTRGVLPFMVAQFAVMFLMVLFPQLVTVPATWFAG